MDACIMCVLAASDDEETYIYIDGVQQIYALGTQILSFSALLSSLLSVSINIITLEKWFPFQGERAHVLLLPSQSSCPA